MNFTAMKKILSIDGGGIRGIIPATILAEIEKQTGKPVASMFDLIAGTSTGGIIALGLTKPDNRGKPEHSAESLVRLYENEGNRIFHQSFLRMIDKLGSLLDEKYPNTNIEPVLRRYFKDTWLSEAITNVLITAYEIERRDTFFFKSTKAKHDKGRNFLMRDAARATSAAPTYFEPKKIPTADLSDYYALVDGGVFANNPAMCAYVEAKNMFPNDDEFLVVSLGTGEMTKPIFYDNARHWGLIQWARPVLNVVLDGVNDAVDYQLLQLLPITDKRLYYRFQIQLDEGEDSLDNTNPQYIRTLKLYAENLIKDNQEMLFKLCEALVK